MGTMASAQVQQWAAPRPLWSAESLLRLPQLWLLRRFRRSELADCGLDPEIVCREATKPFWRE
jgi:uncharacterized protein YjiS (DUF1127 family)